MYTVYMHITPTNKRYIGITSMDLECRWKNGDGYKKQLFGKAIKKYGWDNIEHTVLATNLSKDWACTLEQMFIRDYKCKDPAYGYNLSDGGECSALGLHHTKESKEKIRKANTGRIVSNETRQKLHDAFVGRPVSDEQKQALREINLCKKLSEETKEKISKSNIGKHSGENNSMWHKGLYGERNGMFGKHHTDETKQYLREINSGEKNHFYGKHHTEESKQKMRGPRKPLGKQSPEQIQKRVESRRRTLELKKLKTQ